MSDGVTPSLVPSRVVRGHPLVEQAHAALCRLADAPPATDAVAVAIAEIERAWSMPFVVGIAGDAAARAELFNIACGAKLLDPHARALGSAAIRIRRGATTGFRAFRDDGTSEAQPAPPDREADIATARARAAAARDALQRANAIVYVDTIRPKRPAIWAFWMWPVYWIAIWLANKQHPDRGPADRALAEARTQLSTLDADADAIEADDRLAQQRYTKALQDVAGGGPIGKGVLEVEITLAASPLPAGVEIIELVGASRASAEVDAVLLAQGDKLLAPTRGGHPLSLGDHAHVLAALPVVLAEARALRIARRVETKIKTVLASLADAIERKEATFRQRIAKLQALRLEDPTAFAAEQLGRMRGEISASVTAVVEHASVHLGSELAQLQQEWIGWIADAPDPDALKAAVTKVEEEWHARPHRIADEVRVLVMGGLGGSARDIYPKAVDALAQYGLPDEHARIKAVPALPPVTLFPVLTKEAAKLEKASWFAGLFRSFDTRRAEIREKVHDRVERMRELAASELLDAEPRLHHAIGTALAGLLETAMDHQQAWLDGALAAERAAIDKDRETIEPLRSVHDAVRTETYRLAEMLAQLERREPAIAVAAAAAETASLSR
jgi:hypothetical protein